MHRAVAARSNTLTTHPPARRAPAAGLSLSWLPVLLAFIPVSVLLNFVRGAEVWVFAAACLSIVPLAGLMGAATEEIARTRGAAVGGLLNATFGNATELIIAFIAVAHGEVEVVKATLIGSILGNVLLVLGFSVLCGGIRYKIQEFNGDVARLHATMLGMAVISLLVPALFVRSGTAVPWTAAPAQIERLSLGVASVLMLLYFGSLYFSLRTHENLFQADEPVEPQVIPWRRGAAILTLLAATMFVAVESEFVVRSIEPVVRAWGVSRLFLGVIVIPIVGNAAEHGTALLMAIRDRIDVSLSIAVSSSTQIAMFVAPLVIFLSPALGHPVSILFSNLELVALTAAVAIAVLISMDGKSHWLEGAQLIATYLIVALAFYFIPG